MNSVQIYIEKLQKELSTGRAREHSYRPALKDLIEELNDDMLATNEPAREKCGAPDFVITDKKNIPRGYIEAKDIIPGILDKKENQTQIKKYFDGELGYNFIHTDNLEFRFYRENELVETVIIGEIKSGKIQEIPENFEKLEELLKNFLTFHGQTIKSAKKLSKIMAGKARMIRNMILEALQESENCESELRVQYETFRKILMHDMEIKDFSDVYAQTITYGLFAARLHDPTLPTFDRDEAARLLPKSNPFLRKFFQTLRDDIDPRIEWIVDDLIEVFKACDVKKILGNYGKTTRRHDPIVHFYEDFLADYDPKLRKARGVWYTPEPVVDFIVRGVDDLLKSEFGITDGLADKSKITIKAKTDIHDQRTKEKVKMTDKEVHRVQVLDPATGTGTFLSQVVKQVHSHYANMPAIWSEYVKKDLIPRIHGFEILMASYSMAHLKLDLLLEELGYKNTTDERFGIYLTNSLEEAHPDTNTIFSSWLSEEANEANRIKQDTPVMCVIGNPPYNAKSKNKGEWILNLIKDYKKGLNEKSYNSLSDDYVKFLRFSQHYIDKNGQGIVAMITNNSFLDGVTHRQMRKHMLESYDKIYIVDLHGNTKKKEICPDGSKDENVFDIEQGVSINFFVKTGENKKLADVYHYDAWGKRNKKYLELENNSIKALKWEKIENKDPYYFFIPKDFKAEGEYNKGFRINELFSIFGGGVQTKRDNLFVSLSETDLLKNINTAISGDYSSEFSSTFNIKNSSSYDLINRLAKASFNEKKSCHYSYKPFDTRRIYYDKDLIGRNAYSISKHFVSEKNNFSLNLMRKPVVDGNEFSTIFVSGNVIDVNFYGFQSYSFPLYLYPDTTDQTSLEKSQEKRPNLDIDICLKIAQGLDMRGDWLPVGIAQPPNPDGSAHVLKSQKTFSPEDIFDYIYAILHSPTYRATYKEFLKIDFPRIPYPKNPENFWKLVDLGRQIRELHLLESPLLSASKNIKLKGGTDLTIEKPKYDPETKRVYINETVYFEGVPKISWDFYIGGYQPAQKWLKDRKGRQIYEDVDHYRKMMVSMSETDRLMKEIDKVIKL